MPISSRIVSALLLALAVACGGSKAPPPASPPPAVPAATGIGYVDPVATGWRLVKDPGSTPQRLVLNLVGPAGLFSRGAGFNLQAPAGVRFGAFAETGMPIRAGTVYELKATTGGDGNPLEPVLVAGGVKPGNVLTAAAFQKDRRASAKDSGGTLFQIALEFDAGAGLEVGGDLPLHVTKSKFMAADIGVYSRTPSADMKAKAVLQDITVAIGTLTAN